MPNEIDVNSLLKPISESAPSGDFLRYEGTYDKIEKAREQDDPDLPRGVWERNLKKADWPLVADLCTAALREKTKDLWIATRLCEAWTEMAGLMGVDATLRLIHGLCEGFWDTLYPSIEDDEGAEARVQLLDWLDEVVAVKLQLIPITAPSGNLPAYTLSDWNASLHLSPGAGRLSGDEAPVTHEAILARLSVSKYETWLALDQQVDSILGLESAFGSLLASKAPKQTAFRRLDLALAGIKSIAAEGMKLTKPDADMIPSTAPPPAGGGAPGFGVISSARSQGGSIASRADAYVRLNEAAEYLLRTEPHSPVPYLVKRAIAWGNMSLGQLLYELMGSTDDLVAIQELLGMRKKGGEE